MNYNLFVFLDLFFLGFNVCNLYCLKKKKKAVLYFFFFYRRENNFSMLCYVAIWIINAKVNSDTFADTIAVLVAGKLGS